MLEFIKNSIYIVHKPTREGTYDYDEEILKKILNTTSYAEYPPSNANV
jgi:hypothetical protein